MKTLISSIIIIMTIGSIFGTAQAFIMIDKTVKSVNYKPVNDSNVIGHRVDSNGNFVLVTSK